MGATDTPVFEPGEYAKDRVAYNHPDRDANIIVIFDVHRDTAADEFVVNEETGETLSDITPDWPQYMPDSYDADEDFVVEVAYYKDLDRTFGGEWLEWSFEKTRRLCKINDVTIYSFHASRLRDASPMKFPPQ